MIAAFWLFSKAFPEMSAMPESSLVQAYTKHFPLSRYSEGRSVGFRA
jgi:hypothetical protein